MRQQLTDPVPSTTPGPPGTAWGCLLGIRRGAVDDMIGPGDARLMTVRALNLLGDRRPRLTPRTREFTCDARTGGRRCPR